MAVIAVDARLVGGTNTGDSTYWAGLLYGLSRIQPMDEIILFGNHPKPDLAWLDQFRWVQLHAKSSRWWSLVTFPREARRHGARAIHTQYSLSPLVGTRGITTIHDVSFYIGPQWFRPKDRFILQRGIPFTVERAARVLCVSNTARQDLLQYVPRGKGKAVVTYNACPPWIQRVPLEEARGRAAQLGFDGPFALTVGTRWPRKNMRLAVEAMSMLPASVPHKLAVTGKFGWGENELGTRGIATGYVSNEDLSCLYSAADLYLAPSKHEGFGIPVLEAFRCGCPVIASTGGALPEVVGNAGIVEPSWSAGDWSRRIEKLLQDRSRLDDLRASGDRREKEFTWEDTARRTMDVYLEVARDQA